MKAEDCAHMAKTRENGSWAWRHRKGLMAYAVGCGAVVTLMTILLYSFYGPLTPNNNRYYHSFDMSTVPWQLVIGCIVTFCVLNYGIYRNYKATVPPRSGLGVFPSNSKTGNFFSNVLTVWLLLTEALYTIGFTLCALIFITERYRIMDDDYPMVMQVIAYFFCVIFWLPINLVYAAKARKSRKSQQFSQPSPFLNS